MSVINKMLRDLDARQSKPQLSPLQGTLTLSGSNLARRSWWPSGLLVLAVLGLMGWGLSPQPATPGRDWALEAPVTLKFEAPASERAELQAAAEEPQEEVLEATRRPGAALPMSLILKLSGQMLMPTDFKAATLHPPNILHAPPKGNEVVSESLPAAVASKKEASTLPSTSQPSSQPSPLLATPQPAPVSSTVGHAPVSMAPGAQSGVSLNTQTAAPTPNTAVPTVTVNRHLALQENLQQAQQLWQSGSREAALDVLRATLQSAERSAEAVQSPEFMALLREWARMTLAMGRAAEVMAVVNKHAAQLQGQPDIWALQGHAAQRLGQHTEAVEAYHHALNSRPNEGRWLLASAVSHAALGQADAAARQLQRARAQGPVKPEILAYLKQAGVALP